MNPFTLLGNLVLLPRLLKTVTTLEKQMANLTEKIALLEQNEAANKAAAESERAEVASRLSELQSGLEAVLAEVETLKAELPSPEIANRLDGLLASQQETLTAIAGIYEPTPEASPVEPVA